MPTSATRLWLLPALAAVAVTAVHRPPLSRYRAVTVLHAPVPHLSYTLTNVAGNLGAEWPIMIVHAPAATPSLRTSTAVARLSRRNQLHALPAAAIGAADLGAAGNTIAYTRMMTSDAFWHAVAADKVLTFQTDSVLCSMSPWRVDHFLRYDYVGAPWVRGIPADVRVGNGGLSLRSVRVMRWIIANVPFKEGYVEDMYFARAVQRMEREGLPVSLAPVGEASRFAFEDEDAPSAAPFGVHRCMDVRDGAKAAVLAVCPEAAFGVWAADLPAAGLATDARAPADGIQAPAGVGKDWDWGLTVAEAQKGYVRGAAAVRHGTRAQLRHGGMPVEAADGAGRRRSREG